jgi:hypothetical protein
MSVIFKTTINSPSKHLVDRNADEMFDEAAATAPSEQQILLDALGDAMGMLAAEQRKEREQEASALREKIAMLEGRVDVLMRLMEGKGQIIDLPPLPARRRHVA